MDGDSADSSRVLHMSDEELFKNLKIHGFDVGPIVDSTRLVYQKKLIQILEGGYTASPDYSDSEEESQGFREKEYQQNTADSEQDARQGGGRNHSPSQYDAPPFYTTQQDSPYPTSDVRERVRTHSPSRYEAHAPGFSDQLKDTHITKSKAAGIVEQETEPTFRAQTPQHHTQEGSSVGSVTIKLFLIVILIILAALIYHNMEDSPDNNPIPNIKRD